MIFHKKETEKNWVSGQTCLTTGLAKSSTPHSPALQSTDSQILAMRTGMQQRSWKGGPRGPLVLEGFETTKTSSFWTNTQSRIEIVVFDRVLGSPHKGSLFLCSSGSKAWGEFYGPWRAPCQLKRPFKGLRPRHGSLFGGTKINTVPIATLDIAAALPIATSTPVTNLRQYTNSDLGYNDLIFQLLCSI